MEDTADYDPGDYINSWMIGDAGGGNSDNIVTSDGTVNESDVFPGGFAGNCQAGQHWQRTDTPSGREWICSGDIPWDQTVVAPDYQAEDEPQTVGLYILPHNFQTGSFVPKDEYSFNWAFSSANSGQDVDLESVSAVCWRGGSTDQPSSFDRGEEGSKWFDLQVLGLDNRPDNPVPVYGKLDLSGKAQYTCTWGYTASNGKFYDHAGETLINGEEIPGSVLDDSWFGDGIEKESFDQMKSSGAETQFQHWRDDENTGTSVDSVVECSVYTELGLNCRHCSD